MKNKAVNPECVACGDETGLRDQTPPLETVWLMLWKKLLYCFHFNPTSRKVSSGSVWVIFCVNKINFSGISGFLSKPFGLFAHKYQVPVTLVLFILKTFCVSLLCCDSVLYEWKQNCPDKTLIYPL